MKRKLFVVNIVLLINAWILFIIDMSIIHDPVVENMFTTLYLILSLAQAILIIYLLRKNTKQ